jgi:Arc/MetJ-type ribon-helix-helix transcriptional regulator
MATEVEGKIYSVPIPAELDAEVRERMRSAGFGSLSEYVRTAIRADLERARHAALEQRLLRAIERGHFKDVTPEFFQDLRALARGERS